MKNINSEWETVVEFKRDGYTEYFWESGIVTIEYSEGDIWMKIPIMGRHHSEFKRVA